MKRVAYFSISFIMLLSIVIAALPPHNTQAAVSSCSATLSPHQVEPGSNTTYQFQFTNTASETIQWIRISRPSANFTLASAAATGWSASLSADNAIFSGGGLDPGYSLTLRVTALVESSTPYTTQYWSMFVSDDPGGSGQFACDGDLSVTVGSPSPPVISNVSASNLTTTTATITWTTSTLSSSQVRYGPTASYGSTSTLDSTPVNNHSIRIGGLSPGSSYHYQVVSSNSDGSTSSTDNTFKTATQAPNGGSGITQNTPSAASSGTIAPLKAKPVEKIPPVVNLTSNFEGVFKQVPTVLGTASDNESISKVEYSLNGGEAWLPADHVEFLTTNVYGRLVTSTNSVKFSFTPVNLEDGDFQLVARVTDTSGNQAVTGVFKLVIDRLPPLVGTSLVAVGPQILNPNQDGVITSTVGIDQQITMSAAGGASSIVLTASVEGNDKLTRSFTLSKAKDTGLWTGVLSFQQPGSYSLMARAIDGADNVTLRRLSLVQVVPPSTVVDAVSQKPLSNAQITLYYYVQQTSSWAVWDGEAYGQTNPQKTDAKGQFNFFLPPGKYYLKVKAAGYRNISSSIFEIESPMPLTTTLTMRRGWLVPFWTASEINLVKRKMVNNPSGSGSLVGRRAPSFTLPNTKGKLLNSAELNGKMTVLSFMSTWSPAAREQIGLLTELSKNTAINVVPVAVLDQPGRVEAILRLGGYNLPMLVDRDGTTLADYLLQDIPTHIFLDRDGIIKKVMVGVLSKEELLANLAK